MGTFRFYKHSSQLLYQYKTKVWAKRTDIGCDTSLHRYHPSALLGLHERPLRTPQETNEFWNSRKRSDWASQQLNELLIPTKSGIYRTFPDVRLRLVRSPNANETERTAFPKATLIFTERHLNSSNKNWINLTSPSDNELARMTPNE